MESREKSTTQNSFTETGSLTILKYLNDSLVERTDSGPRLRDHTKQSFKKTGSEFFSDSVGALANSDGKIRLTNLNVPAIMRNSERMSPVVVLPDLKFVMQRQGKGGQIRVPFGKVNPLTLRETLPEDTGRRRNATRACKKQEAGTKLVSLRAEEIQQPPPPPVLDRCITSRKRRPNTKVPRNSELHRSFCKYCGKSFAFEDFAKEHEIYCAGGPGLLPIGPGGENPVLDEAERKVNFLNLFGLWEIGLTESVAGTSGLLSHPEQKFDELDEDIASVSAESGPLNPKRLRSKKFQLSSFLRTNPVPFSSNFGRKFVLESKVGVCQNPEELTHKYDQFCAPSTSRLYVKENKQNWPTTISRKMKFKKYQYVHQCTFNRTQRLARNAELVLGMNSRASDLFNSCKDVSIIVNKMRDEDADKYMWKRQIRNLIHSQRHPKVKRGKPEIPGCLTKFPRVEIVGLENSPEGREILRRNNINIISRHSN